MFRDSDYGMSATGTINGGWRGQGNCRSEHPETMWPEGNRVLIAQARRVCRGCPVTVKCLEQGIASGDWDSVRGGYTGSERHNHARKGLAPADYPEPVAEIPVVKGKRPCKRCARDFDVDPQHPYSQICQPCTTPKDRWIVCLVCACLRRWHSSRGLCEGCAKACRRKGIIDRYPKGAVSS